MTQVIDVSDDVWYAAAKLNRSSETKLAEIPHPSTERDDWICAMLVSGFILENATRNPCADPK